MAGVSYDDRDKPRESLKRDHSISLNGLLFHISKFIFHILYELNQFSLNMSSPSSSNIFKIKKKSRRCINSYRNIAAMHQDQQQTGIGEVMHSFTVW